MSELNPNNSRIGYVYRSALGLRLLREGTMIEVEGSDPYRVSPTRFIKTGRDEWSRCWLDGRIIELPGAATDVFRSEQIFLPATLVDIPDPESVPKSWQV